MTQLYVTTKYNEGRPAFEVPVIEHERGRGPRCPVGGYSAFYTPDNARCFVVVSKTAESYLKQRNYARPLGNVRYSPNGIGHFDWRPGKADDPDPALAEYDHIKRQWANRPEAYT